MAHSSPHTLTGSDVVQNLPWKWNVQGRIFLIGGLGFMFDAWDVSLNGVLIPLLSEEWNLEPGQAAWIGTANLLGMAVGAFVWSTIADRIGRKAAFTATIATFALFTIAGVLATDVVTFAILRFIAGFGLGGAIPVDYALVGEFTPRRQRGRVLAAMDAWWPIGAALAGFVSAWLVGIFADWRPTMLVMVLPAILLIFVRLWVPESPMYLIRTNQHDKARHVIDRLVEATGAEPKPYQLETMTDVPTMSSGAIFDQLRRVWAYSWKITLSVWLLFLTIMFVYYVSLQWLPTFLIEAGYIESQAFITTGGMAAFGLVGALIATYLIERTGRRPLLAISAIIGSLLLVLLAMVLDAPSAVLPVILTYGMVIQVAIPVMYAYASEIYPTELRASGFGWASTISRISAGVGPLIFITALVPVLGLPGSFLVGAGTVVVAVIVMFVLAPETTGRKLEN
ncbi:MFS transporter [Auritidibacter ignavus]|uniref:MFS transporter n=1 Tax=Auritidibacter ignavus TaxID=678932 RepID=UPI0024BB54FC|nr:MFS transporter [Auritidibacter ignavus]WHS28595.1 MFS transporter [Auritidibacter ignavus]